MKKLLYIFPILTLFTLLSCEEVVNVDLETAPSRLVIDAAINWEKGTDGFIQTIRLTTTTGYYDTVIPTADGASVTVTNSTGTVFEFLEDPGTGNYICQDFVPVIGENYALSVIWNGQEFTAEETLKSVSEIADVVQNNEGGFLGDEIEVRFFFQDPPSEENYYYIITKAPVLAFPELDTFSDEFFNGNQSFGFFSDEDLAPGHNVTFEFYGVSRRYHEYISRIMQNSGTGPFGTAASTVRGNIINQTDESNYALGFFRVSELDVLDYVVQ